MKKRASTSKKRRRTKESIQQDDSYNSDSYGSEDENNKYLYMTEKELKNADNVKGYIFSLFSRKIYAEIYFAWCKDCNETFSAESAKYFRDELLSRGNKDLKNFNFRCLRVSQNFLLSFVGNLPPGQIKKVELQDNMVSDICMHHIKSLISIKNLEYLNLASNMISTEGLKIIQNEVMKSNNLKYLNLGVIEGSFRRNNFNGEGGIILARILLNNHSIETLILQDNELGEDAGDKIGAALIQNKTIKKLVLSDNKIKNKGSRSIIENGQQLISLDLSNNDISAEVCYELKNLIISSNNLKEIIWNGNNVGLKGISSIVDALRKNNNIKSLSLKSTSIGISGITSLANGLFNNETLEILDIGSNSINYESFKELCDALNNNKIRILKCKNNLLGDESMKYFSETILCKETNSCLTAFDFSACKIYDQGLIYLLNELQNNDKITWINLKDNYFSHEIDFVILNFLEKNTNLTYLDLTKNRFSFQCLQKVNKIIQRNRKIQNNKEPNRLLVQLYSLKYENTKLNELKDTLKIIENDNEKLRLNKADLRQDYEISKNTCNEQIALTNKKIIENKYLLNLRQKELKEKKEEYEKIKGDNTEKMDRLNQEYEELCQTKEKLDLETNQLNEDFERIQKELMDQISDLNDVIDKNRLRTGETQKEIKAINNEIASIEKEINERKEKIEKERKEKEEKEKEEKEKLENEKEQEKKEEEEKKEK